MSISVTFQLENSDLQYFREVMREAQVNVRNLSERTILANAKKLSSGLSSKVPVFVQSRLQKLALLIDMLEDTEWNLPESERVEILASLAYFSDANDLVPDHIPVLGFLDDAIMIELVEDSLSYNISAYQDFCKFRENELASPANKTHSNEFSLATKRSQLHERVKRNRAKLKGNNQSFGTIFGPV